MSDIVDRLRNLCAPEAETLSDGWRVKQFIKVGNEAADEIERLRTQLAEIEEAATDEGIERNLCD